MREAENDHPYQIEPLRLAEANVRPRLLMTTPYYLIKLRNGLVVCTGNKSESLVAYFTKYDDGGVDILSIATLYKHRY